MALHVAALTGSRADWGLLAMPLAALRDMPGVKISIIATGQHLGRGHTIDAIHNDGFTVDAEVDPLLTGDTGLAIAKGAAVAQIGIAEALKRLSPDIVLVLGDRYEILAGVSAALLMRIPVAHIAGGDITEGAMDDAIRHSVTKMSHLHFATNEASAKLIRQLGEPADRIHVVGSPGIDRILSLKLLPRDEAFKKVGLEPRRTNLVITFHPVTLSDGSLPDLRELLAALDGLGDDVGLVFTGVNADPEGDTMDREIAAFCAKRTNAVHHNSLGSLLYLSIAAACDAAVGNSSSGLYEIPSLGKPTIDIGERQRGRLRATSVIHCEPERSAIAKAIQSALKLDVKGTSNPYGDGKASRRIADVIASIKDPRALLQKQFQVGVSG